MRFALLAAVGVLGSPSLSAQAPARAGEVDGNVIAVADYVLPAFDSAPAGFSRELLRYAGRAEYDSTRADREFVMRKVRYRSGGHAVVAYWYGPASAAVRPGIIYNRGSWTAGDLAPSLAPLFRRLARAGYAVLAPQYRGSDGGEGRDEMGGGDLADVLVLPRVAAAVGIDTTRLFLYGESRGGMMTLQALREGIPVRAAATVGAFTDMEALMRDDPAAAKAATVIWPELAAERGAIIARRSAVRWADSIRTPLLILHGGADGQVSPSHALELARLLQERRRTYELHVFAGEGHVIGKRSRERDAAVLAWFARHGGAGGP